MSGKRFEEFEGMHKVALVLDDRVTELQAEVKVLQKLISQHHSLDFSQLSPGEACPICQKAQEVKDE